MPFDVLSATAGSVPTNMDMLNLVGGAFTNVQNQKANKAMYEQQYKDAIAFWNMNNAYNTPEAQMNRFKDAGLSPWLIYGQGNAGNAGSPPNVPDFNPASMREPKFEGKQDLMANLLGQADLRIKNAQTNNLEANTEVIRQQAMLQRLDAERKALDLDLDYKWAGDFRAEDLRGKRIQNDVAINRDAREAAQNSSNVQEASERILTMRAQRSMIPYQKDEIAQRIKQMQLDGTLKQLDIDLRKAGIYPNDPLWAKFVGRFFTDTIEKGSSSLGNFWKWLTGE